jgi:hypothetical protein
MNIKVTSVKPFSVWAKEIQNLHPEILQHWLNSTDPFRRAMSRTILEAAGYVNPELPTKTSVLKKSGRS